MADKRTFKLELIVKLEDLASGNLQQFAGQMEGTMKEMSSVADETMSSLARNVDDAMDQGGRAANQFKKVTSDALDEVSRRVAQASESFQRGMINIRTGIQTLEGLGRGVRIAGDFQQSMINLELQVRDTSKSLEDQQAVMDSLRQKSLELGVKTKFSAKGAADAMTELAKIGLSVDQVMGGAAKAVLDFAQSEDLATDRAAIMLGTLSKTFGLSGEQIGFLADQIVKVSAASSASAESITAGFQNAAASLRFVGRSAGLSAEEIITQGSALVGILQDVLGSGEEAGTALNQFFNTIQAPGVAARKTMEELGIEVSDSAGRFKGFLPIIGQFEEKLTGLTDAARAEILGRIFDVRALRAANIFLDTGTKGIERFIAESETQVTLQERVAAQMRATNQTWESFIETLQNVIVAAFTPLLPALTDVTVKLIDMAGALGRFLEKHPAVTKFGIAMIGAFASTQILAGMGQMVFGLRNLTLGIKALGTVLPTLARIPAIFGGLAKIGSIFTRLGPALAAGLSRIPLAGFFTSLGGRIVSLLPGILTRGFLRAIPIVGWGLLAFEIVNFLSKALFGFDLQAKLVEFLQRAATGASAFLKSSFGIDLPGFFEEQLPKLKAIWETIKTALIDAWTEISAKAKEIWNKIEVVITTVTTAIQQFLDQHGEQLIAIAEKIWNGFKTVVEGVWNVIKGIVEINWSFISNIISAGLSVLAGDWQGAWESIKNLLAGVWEGIKKIATGGMQIVSGVIGTVLGEIQLAWTTAWLAVKDIVTTIWDSILNTIKRKLNAILELIPFITFRFAEAVEKIQNITVPEISVGANLPTAGEPSPIGLPPSPPSILPALTLPKPIKISPPGTVSPPAASGGTAGAGGAGRGQPAATLGDRLKELDVSLSLIGLSDQLARSEENRLPILRQILKLKDMENQAKLVSLGRTESEKLALETLSQAALAGNRARVLELAKQIDLTNQQSNALQSLVRSHKQVMRQIEETTKRIQEQAIQQKKDAAKMAEDKMKEAQHTAEEVMRQAEIAFENQKIFLGLTRADFRRTFEDAIGRARGFKDAFLSIFDELRRRLQEQFAGFLANLIFGPRPGTQTAAAGRTGGGVLGGILGRVSGVAGGIGGVPIVPTFPVGGVGGGAGILGGLGGIFGGLLGGFKNSVSKVTGPAEGTMATEVTSFQLANLIQSLQASVVSSLQAILKTLQGLLRAQQAGGLFKALSLGLKIGAAFLQEGGTITTPGLAFLHAGEQVVPAGTTPFINTGVQQIVAAIERFRQENVRGLQVLPPSFTEALATGPIARFANAALSTIPSFQSGGIVPRTGLAFVHRGEQVIPASVVRRPTAQRQIRIDQINITVPPGSRAVDDPEELARIIAREFLLRLELE